MSGSDKKYRTDQQLKNDAAYNRRKENEHRMRAQACENELLRRHDLEHHGHEDV